MSDSSPLQTAESAECREREGLLEEGEGPRGRRGGAGPMKKADLFSYMGLRRFIEFRLSHQHTADLSLSNLLAQKKYSVEP